MRRPPLPPGGSPATRLGNRMNGTNDDRRVSEQTWLTEKDAEATARLTKRIDTFLDLEAESTTHSELYQVANYGIAGQYEVHYDQVMMDKNHMQNREVFNIYAGDRIATLMGYLSDVLVLTEAEALPEAVEELVGEVAVPEEVVALDDVADPVGAVVDPVGRVYLPHALDLGGRPPRPRVRAVPVEHHPDHR